MAHPGSGHGNRLTALLAGAVLVAGCDRVADVSPDDTPADSGTVGVDDGAFARTLDAVATANAVLQDAIERVAGNPATRALVALGPDIAFVADSFADIHGRTFAFDPQAKRYLPDSTRAGAPATGLRFILYEIDSTGLAPRVPLVETGRVDVVNLSSSPDAAFTVTVAGAEATWLDYTASGAAADTLKGPEGLKCCDMALLAAPRHLAATGSLDSDTLHTPFEYADTTSQDNNVHDRRLLGFPVTPLGHFRIRSNVATNFRWGDSDLDAKLRIAVPRTNGGAADSTVFDVAMGGIEGHLWLGVIAVDGDSALLDYGGCRNTYGDCFKFRGTDVQSDTLDQFRQLLLSAAWLTVREAYSRAPGPAEALLSPAIFALRWRVRHPE